MNDRWILGICAVALMINNGCSSNSLPSTATTTSAPPTQATSATAPHTRLYISDGADPGTVKVYAWPSTHLGSTLATLAGDGEPSGLAFDRTGRLYVANGCCGDGTIQAFSQPISNGANPTFTLKPLQASSCYHPARLVTVCGPSFQSLGDVAVDTAGDLALSLGYFYSITHCIGGAGCFYYYTFDNSLLVYSPPVTSSSPPHEILLVCTEPVGVSDCPRYHFGRIAFDNTGNLWAIRTDGLIDKYVPPFGSSSTTAEELPITASDVKFDSAGNMYLSATNSVDVYRPPFSPSMTKAFSINVPTPGYLAFDASGKLLVSSGGTRVVVFAPPFTSASKPVATLPIGASGIAIGP